MRGIREIRRIRNTPKAGGKRKLRARSSAEGVDQIPLASQDCRDLPFERVIFGGAREETAVG